MRIEVLAIGDELLDGRVADTNTLTLAQALAQVGHRIQRRTTVLDDVAAIVDAARSSIARGTGLCVVSGGLGPTSDDRTTEAIAQLADVGLRRDAAAEAAIRGFFTSRGYPLSDNQLKQADMPEGATKIDNPVGTAPGFAVVVEGCRFVCLPGVPAEFRRMLDPVVASLGVLPSYRRSLCVVGLPEGGVGQRLTDLERRPGVRVGYRATFPEIYVTLSAADASTLDAIFAGALAALGDHVVSQDGLGMAATVLARLNARGETLALAESCTGGLIGDLITDVSGASAVLRGGVVAYSDEVKTALLGIGNELLSVEGAVSEACVVQMARHARARFEASWALAVSGIAGPTGGSATKPVGLVWLALAGPDGHEETRRLQLRFDRRRNKVAAAYAALDLLRRRLDAGAKSG